jgi:hypothetical protein
MHIGFEQREAHFAQGRVDIRLGQLAPAAQLVEDIIQAFAQVLEHGSRFGIVVRQIEAVKGTFKA